MLWELNYYVRGKALPNINDINKVQPTSMGQVSRQKGQHTYLPRLESTDLWAIGEVSVGMD